MRTPPEPGPPASADLYGRARLRMFREGDETCHVPNAALKRLIDIQLAAADTRTAQVVLLWPSTLRLLPLTHVFATAERWTSGDKFGVRTLLYPAKANSLYPFNHLYLGRAEIRSIAQTLAEVSGRPNPLVARSLRQKDSLLIKAGSIKELRPCLKELIPHFEVLTAQHNWSNSSNALLEHLLTKLRRRAERTALKATFALLGEPATAPDALFMIGYQLNKHEIRRALMALVSWNTLDVLVVDATRPVRLTVERWSRKLEDFVAIAADVMGARMPGLVVVTDDPGVALQLRERLERATAKVRLPINQLRLAPVVCCSMGDGLRAANTAEVLGPDARRFEITIRDKDASKLIASFYKTIHKLNLDPDVALPLRDAASFLHNLSGLPASQDIVNTWLDEHQADSRFRNQFNWVSYKAAVVDFIARGHAGDERPAIETTLRAADELVRHYRTGTALSLAMADFASLAAPDHRVAMVFTKPMLRLFAERFLKHAQYSAGRSFEQIRSHLELLLTSELSRHLGERPASRYIFVGLDEQALLFLATDNRIPDGSRILLTYRAGLYMRWTLKSIFAFKEFAVFHPRIQMLLEQLAQQIGVDPRSVLQRDDFVLSTFDFSVPVSGTGQTDLTEGTVTRIDLSDAAPLYRGERAALYIYEPAHEDAGRGGFRCVEVGALRAGDRLFQLSEDLRHLLEDVLQRAGVPLARDRPFEQMLREYHQRVTRKLSEHFPLPSRAAQVQAIRARITQRQPDIKDLPDNIGHWVDLGSSSSTPFDRLRPQAPRNFAHFRAFADALGFDKHDITHFWQFAIQPIRIQRRLDGRYVGDLYANILFDPESAIVHAGALSKRY